MNTFTAGVALDNVECVWKEIVGLLAIGEVGIHDRSGTAVGADGFEGSGWSLGVAEDEDDMGTSLG